MKFEELPGETKSHARAALAQLLAGQTEVSESMCEILGRSVAAAFVEMERFDGAPVVKIGDGSVIPEPGDQYLRPD
ncbi:hypothetical protein MUA04_23975 [Enterobacteriaceae bacterium H11S18]|uniref:hypothetical protein n=1 Tax=Dryocola clanedunensis TaxID=2925396 RepID=UPI0022F0253B|nr:hypothetical protein [Dryocola clanedunensis]MCT4713233.1 hypothetical protein [Dryocola clanedunensis]